MVQFITWLIIGTIIEHNGTTSLKLMYNLDFFTIKLNFLPNCITSSLSSRIMHLTFFFVFLAHFLNHSLIVGLTRVPYTQEMLSTSFLSVLSDLIILNMQISTSLKQLDVLLLVSYLSRFFKSFIKLFTLYFSV